MKLLALLSLSAMLTAAFAVIWPPLPPSTPRSE
jgi:hypothetical protein